MMITAFMAMMCFLTSCEWTEPENLNYRRQTLGEQDPEAYEHYLESLRAYKNDEGHLVTILTMDGTSEDPMSQNRHPMSMPDSADYICMKVSDGLHPSIAAEIREVREKKGTKSVNMVDFVTIEETWNAMEDEKKAQGLPAGTIDELKAYFKEQTIRQLSYCDSYGFDGVMVSWEGNTNGEVKEASYDAFMGEVTQWKKSHPDHLMFMRGTITNIKDKTILDDCRYIVVILGASGTINTTVNNMLRYVEQTDRVVLEVSVPSSEEPKQLGVSVMKAAEWTLEPYDKFTKRGLCVGNAHDDYYNEEYIFKAGTVEIPLYVGNYANIRPAITRMNN